VCFQEYICLIRRNLAILAAEALAILVVGGVVARWRLTPRS